ncbi:MAG: ImmA/IrrE family metallo-endopeptidase [Solirubrobacterales bacterium]|nr:ImmA/IrrE family metallo-endopeptidase [Solirubrobacterales bacterium]
MISRSFADPAGGPAVLTDRHGADVAAMEARAIAVLDAVPDTAWDGRPPVPIEWIATEMFDLHIKDHADLEGLTGVKLPEGKSLSGLLLPDQGVILVNADEVAKWPNRRRFTIAHELGHWVMHRDNMSYLRSRSAAPAAPQITTEGPPSSLLRLPIAEAEANAFAAALLLPASLLRSAADACACDSKVLVDAFASTYGAMQRRLVTLGYELKEQMAN